MKIARFNDGRVGVISDDCVYDITELVPHDAAEWPPVSMMSYISKIHEGRDALQDLSRFDAVSLAEVRLEAPVPWPSKIIAYPINYDKHGDEMDKQYRADNQGFFLKPPSSTSGPNDSVVLPALPAREVHHECELGIVIGETCRSVNREKALDVVFGYTCLMDMVVRGKEERVMRKAYDTFCPIGPWIVTADEIPDPSELEMSLHVNDELRQKANTRDLVLDIPGMIEVASGVMTLYPGDIIATGTPEGVGPIVDGDDVTIMIERVGSMTVPVVQGNEGLITAFSKRPS